MRRAIVSALRTAVFLAAASGSTLGAASVPPASIQESPQTAGPALKPAGRDPLRMNFGSARDDDGTPIFTPFLAAIWQDGDLPRAERWLKKLADEGTTVILVQLESKPYPGYAVRGFDFRRDLQTFARYLQWLQQHAAGDGAAWRFFVQLSSGDRDRVDDYKDVAGVVDALRAFTPYVARWCPGFESVGAWPKATLIKWLDAMRRALGADAIIEGWGQPGYGRDTAAIAELARHGMSAFGFQFAHGRAVTEPCGRSVDDRSGRGRTYPRGCAFEAFDAVVARLGAGRCTDKYGNGAPCASPTLIVDAIETDTYDAFRGRSNPAIAERIATDALEICAAYGVSCGFGSGLPAAWRKTATLTSPAPWRPSCSGVVPSFF